MRRIPGHWIFLGGVVLVLLFGAWMRFTTPPRKVVPIDINRDVCVSYANELPNVEDVQMQLEPSPT